METLQEIMKKLLAENFALYLKAQNYHWNVEGSDFVQLHEFFGDFYSEVYGAVDQIGEEIRALDTYTPASFSRYMELSEIKDETNVPDAQTMIKRLLADNETILKTILMASKLAEKFDAYGLQNFLTERQDAHKKHAWMLKSISKGK